MKNKNNLSNKNKDFIKNDLISFLEKENEDLKFRIKLTNYKIVQLKRTLKDIKKSKFYKILSFLIH